MDVDGLVVREGDRVAAAGRLVRNDLGDWFEPALPIAAPGGLERRVRPVWRGAVRVAGADFDAVAGRFEKDGLAEGWATVTGTWSGEQLRVERQDPGTAPADRGRCWPACSAARCPPAKTACLRVIPGSHCGDRDLVEGMPSGSRVRRCCRPCARSGPAHRHRPATLVVRE